MDELREAFEEAWDDSEGEAPEAGEESTETLAEETQEESTEQDVSDDTSEDSETAESQEGDTAPNEEVAESDIADKATDAKTEKAPASWTPAARENWSKIPAAAQAQITKREQQMSKYMQDTAPAKNFIKSFQKTIEPYQNAMMAAGVKDPMQVVGALMNNDNILRNGDTQTKADLVASMINKFGVDIETLDNILTGQPAPEQNTGGNHVQDMIRKEMAPFHNMMQQQEVNRQNEHHQIQQNAANEVQSFAHSNEFLNDVRGDMADLLDMAASRGQAMTMQEAYDKACALNPDISKVMDDRKILQNSQNAMQKRNAASSVTGAPGGSGGSSSAGSSLRDQIANAWNDTY